MSPSPRMSTARSVTRQPYVSRALAQSRHGIGLRPGDRFLVELSPDEPDTIRLHRIRESYAGGLREVYGKATDYLTEERRSWERR